MNRARTYHCTRMRHGIEQSNGLVPSLLCPSWMDCISATRGYDFRKGQAFCHPAGHVLGSAKSSALQRREIHANCGPPASSVSRQDAPRTTAGSPADRRRRELPAGRRQSQPHCVCRDKRSPEARHYCLLDRLVLHSNARLDAIFGARNFSASRRVPEPTSRIRMVCLAISRGEIKRCLARG